MKIRNLVIVLAFFFVHFSCTEPMDIDLIDLSGNRLVVEGCITSETKSHSVKLSRTTSYFYEEQPPSVSNAIVTISDGTTVYPLTEDGTTGCYYTANDVAGLVGKEYVLNIELTDGEKYTATSILNPVTPLDSVLYYYGNDYIPFTSDFLYHFFIYTQDPSETTDYYTWDLYIDNVLYTDTISKKQLASDDAINGNYIADFLLFTLEDEEIVNDTTEITIEMRSISKSYYDFFVAMMLETEWKSGLFDGPPANVPSNISGDAVGYFLAADVTKATTKVLLRQNSDILFFE